jgi:hypothetical protein
LGLLVLGVMVFINMRKLDRIHRQISAVSSAIQVEVHEAAGNEERASQLLREWGELNDRRAERQQLWWYGGIVAALLLAWFILGKH